MAAAGVEVAVVGGLAVVEALARDRAVASLTWAVLPGGARRLQGPVRAAEEVAEVGVDMVDRVEVDMVDRVEAGRSAAVARRPSA